ncbi:MAG TPA: hypothetical protein PKU88_02145 [Bacillota bacterium]|nr:hypothetical protein [Clostridiaceae bacterium]HNT03437.1 hypothetical protein [Bacillota bacterium]HPX68115.1 hypothetical protein [Bacillota bacterium]HQA64491.1 hypothetical protein [Bacillota bacterium]HQO43901.1 hypothetical protein [Bacillota bacterium]
MKFLKTSFIPDSDVSLAMVDYRISPKIEESLNKIGIECLKTVRCPELYDAVDGHPDMLMFHIGGNRIVLAPNVYEKMAPIIEKKGFAVTKGATWLVRNYPGNIAYNVLRIGKTAFHNIRHTDAEIIKALEKENVKMLNVNQGYTKCSVCILNDNTIITSDEKISEIAEKNGIESFLTKPGGIDLKGLNYGFLGGASGLVSKNKIAFTGSLYTLEDNRKLIDYINKKGFEIVHLSKGRLMDYGSILPLKCR